MQPIGARGRWQRYWEPAITLLRKSGGNVASSHEKLLGLILLIVAMHLTGCATPSIFHATHIPPDSLILAQVRGFATQQEILGIPSLVETLELSGIKRTRIKDGMVGDGRIFCCGGPNESDYAIWFYVPEGIDVSVGDIVEVKIGALVLKGEQMRAPPNTLQRIRSNLEQVGEECRWVPEDPRLWGRVLYCDWMEKEGWVQQGGLFNVWHKEGGVK